MNGPIVFARDSNKFFSGELVIYAPPPVALASIKSVHCTIRDRIVWQINSHVESELRARVKLLHLRMNELSYPHWQQMKMKMTRIPIELLVPPLRDLHRCKYIRLKINVDKPAHIDLHAKYGFWSKFDYFTTKRANSYATYFKSEQYDLPANETKLQVALPAPNYGYFACVVDKDSVAHTVYKQTRFMNGAARALPHPSYSSYAQLTLPTANRDRKVYVYFLTK